MKKIIIATLLMLTAMFVKAQTFPNVDSVKKFVTDSVKATLKVGTLKKAFIGTDKFLPQIVQDTASISLKAHGMLILQRKDSTLYFYDTILAPKRWRRSVPPTFTKNYKNPIITVSSSGVTTITNDNGINDSLSLVGVTTLHTFGDSFTGGAFSEDVNKIYPAQLRDSLVLTLTNLGTNSAGWYRITKDIMQKNYKAATRNSLVTIMAGTLDVISNRNTEFNKNKIQGLVRTSVSNCFIDSVFSFGDSRVTNVGFSDTTVACQSKSLVVLDSVQVAYTSAKTLTFSFTGDNLVIYTFASAPGRSIGKFNVVIDGVNGFSGSYWMQYDGNGLVNGVGIYTLADESSLNIYPTSVMIRGLTNAVHTCVITTVDNLETYLDGWAVMASASAVKPVIIGSIPHEDPNTSLNYSVVYDKSFNYYVDELNYIIRTTLMEFDGYPVTLVDMSKFYYAGTMVQRPDNLHPKTIGQNAFYRGFRDGLKFRRLDDLNFTPNLNLPNPYVAKTSTYAVTNFDYVVDCTSGTFTVTLPSAIGIPGKTFIIKNSGGGTITLATTSSQTIDGSAPGTLATGAVAQLQSTGSNWIKIN